MDIDPISLMVLDTCMAYFQNDCLSNVDYGWLVSLENNKKV